MFSFLRIEREQKTAKECLIKKRNKSFKWMELLLGYACATTTCFLITYIFSFENRPWNHLQNWKLAMKDLLPPHFLLLFHCLRMWRIWGEKRREMKLENLFAKWMKLIECVTVEFYTIWIMVFIKLTKLIIFFNFLQCGIDKKIE